MRALEPVQRFAEAAQAYCSLIESHESLTAYQLLRGAAERLAALYLSALALPEVESLPVEADTPDAFYDAVPMKQIAALSRNLGAKFGNYDVYRLALDPFEDEQVGASSLGVDFADIYGDLKRGLIAFDTGSDNDAIDAVWHWKFSFGNHWGRHLSEGLRAVHIILFDYLITDSDE